MIGVLGSPKGMRHILPAETRATVRMPVMATVPFFNPPEQQCYLNDNHTLPPGWCIPVSSLPAAFNGEEFIGREITFKVEGRCGDPEAGTQTKSIEAVLDKGDITAPKSSIVRVVCEGHESDPDILFNGGAVTIEGSGLAGATEYTFTCQDKAGEKHDTVFGASDFTASADGTRIEISDDMLVGHMRNACSVAMSELDTEADATVKVTLADGSILTYSGTIGE